ncbi:tRNA-dependent cyclodipeptide synthase [Nocardiopsis eucommiae]|uniref:tRNA-dependent cyclodipeptide synthase n=1 Tax=Nocardiopsis eucommiae TaxID=2831970 RepID=UPI003D7232DA
MPYPPESTLPQGPGPEGEIRSPEGAEDVFRASPFTPSCGLLVERGDHALIGISAGNGYFSQQRLAQLLTWTGHRFTAVDLLYADLHLDTMYLASGDDGAHAARRTARALRDVRRRVRRAVEAASDVPARVRVLALSETVDLPGYRSALERIDRRIGEDPRVRRACEEHVRRVVGGGVAAPDARFAAGMSYLRAELPFLLSTPEVLSVPSSVCCYHELLPLLVELGGDTSCLHPGQGHLVLQPR